MLSNHSTANAAAPGLQPCAHARGCNTLMAVAMDRLWPRATMVLTEKMVV